MPTVFPSILPTQDDDAGEWDGTCCTDVTDCGRAVDEYGDVCWQHSEET